MINCSASEHMTHKELVFWMKLRELYAEYQFKIIFDGRTLAQHFKGTGAKSVSKNWVYRRRNELLKSGWLICTKPPAERAKGKDKAGEYLVLSHEQWVANNGWAACTRTGLSVPLSVPLAGQTEVICPKEVSVPVTGQTETKDLEVSVPVAGQMSELSVPQTGQIDPLKTEHLEVSVPLQGPILHVQELIETGKEPTVDSNSRIGPVSKFENHDPVYEKLRAKYGSEQIIEPVVEPVPVAALATPVVKTAPESKEEYFVRTGQREPAKPLGPRGLTIARLRKPNHVPRTFMPTPGTLTLVTGHPGVGKSTLMATVAARISQSGQNTLFFAGEDSSADTIKPRLMAANASFDREYFDYASDNVLDFNSLEEAIEEFKYKLIVVDPLANYGIDPFNNQAVRSALNRFKSLAVKYGVAVCIVTHYTKSGTLGASAMTELPDAIWELSGDESRKQGEANEVFMKKLGFDDYVKFNIVGRDLTFEGRSESVPALEYF